MKRVIAIDFDGVIHRWNGKYSTRLGKPLPGARAAIEKLIARGCTVVVHSCRPASQIEPYLKQQGFPPLKVTREKPIADAYVDDRAIAFGGDWNDGMIDRIMNFKPHWESGQACAPRNTLSGLAGGGKRAA